MTPNLNAGEVFQGPGPLLLAMMEDLRNKPPAGIAIALPQAPRNAMALVGDRSAVISFDPPANVRSAQIINYAIRNNKTGEEISASTSPASISGLKNGTSYTFSIVANNSLGQSEAAVTNSVVPQAVWNTKVFDSLVDGKYLASTSF